MPAPTTEHHDYRHPGWSYPPPPQSAPRFLPGYYCQDRHGYDIPDTRHHDHCVCERFDRVRVSSYQARIERTLTDHFYEVPETRQAGQEWVLTHVAHTNGYAICELCGHNPIKRLFFIRNRDGRELMIGSECARNYASVDLIDAYMRRLARDQSRRRENIRRIAVSRSARERNQARDDERRAAFARDHQVLGAWLDEHCDDPRDFVQSVARQYAERGTLSDRQVEVIERIRREDVERAANPRIVTGNARDRAATPDDLPHIYNGTYTLTDLNTAEHLSYQIYTPQRGSLQGLRIVKRLASGGRYEGFAFVDRDGGLAVWRRFREDADERYVRWAEQLLHLLDERLQEGPGDDDFYVSGMVEERWRIQRSRACRRCNRALTTPTSIRAGIGPECQRQVAQETRAADPHAVTMDGELRMDGAVLNEAIGTIRGMQRDIADSLSHAAGEAVDATHRSAAVDGLGEPGGIGFQRRARRRTEPEVMVSELGSGEVL